MSSPNGSVKPESCLIISIYLVFTPLRFFASGEFLPLVFSYLLVGAWANMLKAAEVQLVWPAICTV
jgi:hypothetical protein